MRKRIISMLLVATMACSANIATLPVAAKTNVAEKNMTEISTQEEVFCEETQVQLPVAEKKESYEATAQNKPQKASLHKVKLSNKKAVLSWKKQSDVSGYEVYMSKTEHGTYKKIKTITSAATTTYTTGVLANNTVSYFKIRAYKSSKGKKVYGEYSGIRSIARGKVKVNPAKLYSVKIKNKKATLKWKRQDSVSGYVLYMAKSKNGTYKAIRTIKDCATTTYTTSKLIPGNTYYFKVRPYKNVSGVKQYGNASKVKNVHIKQTNKELLQAYYNKTLVPKYGKFDSYQSRTFYSMDIMYWVNTRGIMGISIMDFDGDNKDEMLITRTEKMKNDSPTTLNSYYRMLLEMYEVKDGKVKLVDQQRFFPYASSDLKHKNEHSLAIDKLGNVQKRAEINIVQKNNKQYMVCEYYGCGSFFSDGEEQEYWVLEYKDNTFRYVLSLTQASEGSDAFEYMGYYFKNGKLSHSELIYSTMYGDTIGRYHTLESAVAGIFQHYGFSINTTAIGWVKSLEKSILSDKNHKKLHMRYKNIAVNYLTDNKPPHTCVVTLKSER